MLIIQIYILKHIAPHARNTPVVIAICLLSLLVTLFSVPVIAAVNDENKTELYAEGYVEPIDSTSSQKNSQTIALLDGISYAQFYSQGGAQISVVENALTVEAIVDVTAHPTKITVNPEDITIYVVQSGDTISGIAQKFDVSQNTIIWANNLRNSTIGVGQELSVLPTTGVRHKVVSGDTVKKIANKYDVEIDEIVDFNALPVDAALSIGDLVMVPGGVMPRAKAAPKVNTTKVATARAPAVYTGKPYWKNGIKHWPLTGTGGPNISGYFIRPVSGWPLSRGLHGHNAIDIAAPSGTPVVAAGPGVITRAFNGGWNGGYGKYIMVSHTNGTQTLYAHLSSVNVYVGQSVAQGQLIGRVGTTGNSTGNHLHFEVRGAQNTIR